MPSIRDILDLAGERRATAEGTGRETPSGNVVPSGARRPATPRPKPAGPDEPDPGPSAA